MKNLIFTAFCLISSLSFSSVPNVNNFDNLNHITKSEYRIGIDIWLKSKEGCKFHIVGDYNTWTGVFTGTVQGTGGGTGCPEGTWTFGLVIDEEGGTQLNGENPFIDILIAEPETLTKLVELIQNS